MGGNKKKCPKCEEGSPAWMTTYSDMVTLLLTFFVMMLSSAEIDGYQIRIMLSAFAGIGTRSGGNTLQAGKLMELGNTIESLPSQERGRALDEARKKAVSMFQPEIKSQKVRVKEDERGLIITLAGDAFFDPGSAEINIEETREVLNRLSDLLKGDELKGRKFRIEGHTDSLPTGTDSDFPTNWELSSLRAINTLHVLSDYGCREADFQVMGLADTVPLAPNDTEEGRAYNRRIEIVILNDGHL